MLGRSAPDADGLWPAVWVADVVTSLKSDSVYKAVGFAIIAASVGSVRQSALIRSGEVECRSDKEAP